MDRPSFARLDRQHILFADLNGVKDNPHAANFGHQYDGFERVVSAGLEKKADFMIVVCDTFSREDYPVYVSQAQFAERHAEFDGKNMQAIVEVYDLSLDCEPQVNERRAFHYPEGLFDIV